MADIDQKLRLLKTLSPEKIPKKKIQQFLKGDPGEKGEPGKKGPAGKDGIDGKRGLQGTPGSNGKNGTDGFDGQPGRLGLKGEPGFEGLPGKEGEEGERGPRGHRGAAGGGGGWGRLHVQNVDADYEIKNSDNVILATGTVTVFMPDYLAVQEKHFYVKNVGDGVITVDGLIDDDAAGMTLVKHETIGMVSDGTGWWII